MAHRTRQEVHRAHLYTNTWLRDKPNSTLFSTSRGGSGVPPRFSSALSSNKTASMSRPSTSMQSSNLTEQSEIAKAVTPLQTNNVSTPIRNRNAVTLTSMGTEMPKSPESSSSPSNKNSNNMNESSLAVDSLPNLLPVRGASEGSMRNLLPTTNGNQMHQLASINQRSHYYHSPNNHRVVGTTASAGPNRAKGTRHMILQPNRALLEDQDPQYHDKLVVVLDLDETLAYGRTFGHPKLRPHLHKFLQTLQDLECEVVLWTAGERGYAFSMLEVIDPHGCLFQHCVYRHPRWWSGPRGHKKDLALLGRPLERTFIVENTPDCVRDCVANAILVSDYVGPVAGALGRTQPDHVLSELAQCIQGMWSEIQSGVVSSVAQALQRSPFLIQRTVGADHVPCSVTTWTLRSDSRVLVTNPPPPVSYTSPELHYSRDVRLNSSCLRQKLNVSLDSAQSVSCHRSLSSSGFARGGQHFTYNIHSNRSFGSRSIMQPSRINFIR